MNSQKTIYSSIIVGALALIAIGAYLKSGDTPISSTDRENTQRDFEVMRQHFMDSLREIQGDVQDVSISSEGVKVLTLQTRIPDIAAMTGISGEKEPSFLLKTIHVAITDKTAVPSGQAFKVGNTVAVLLDKGVYGGSNFTALKISLYSRESEIKKTIEYGNIIHGTIKSIGKSSLILEAEVADLAKLATLNVSGSFTVPRISKTYTVVIDKNTELSNIKIGDLKINDSLTAWGDKNLLTINSFVATRIRRE